MQNCIQLPCLCLCEDATFAPVCVCISAVNFLICPTAHGHTHTAPKSGRTPYVWICVCVQKLAYNFNSNKNVAEMKFVTFFVLFIYNNCV